MLDLIGQIVRRVPGGEPVAVCVVARTRGSTPQKAGAAMLVLQNGQTLGTLGGGCVEAEVRSRSLQLLERRESRLLTFSLDHDYGWDDGLVCGGTMEIAVQVVATAEDAQPWRDAGETLAAGREAALTIRVSDDAGQPFAFTHIVEPAPTVVIAGAGHVAMALAPIVQQLGFNVAVIDDRADCVSPQRFPDANRVTGSIDAELARWPIHEHTYVVIVTRGHRHDAQALAAVIGSPARYIGLIGSRRKSITILRDLHASGVPAERLARVHTPIGLSIGAVTPAEIAVSIAAELVAARRGADPAAAGSMRLDPTRLARSLAAYDHRANDPAAPHAG